VPAEEKISKKNQRRKEMRVRSMTVAGWAWGEAASMSLFSVIG